ncbi:hypothetical protein O9929_05060 [Vibrio lentus]|nr:hypothetical protein [Vibrio lentus]
MLLLEFNLYIGGVNGFFGFTINVSSSNIKSIVAGPFVSWGLESGSGHRFDCFASFMIVLETSSPSSPA